MRKMMINSMGVSRSLHPQPEWLDLERMATVEVTSENPNFPIESALAGTKGAGWRAAEPGDQIIRIVFDSPRPLHRILLEFCESDVERTQEFNLRWSQPSGPFKEIVRQQWNFSPQGSTIEIEDYQVRIENVSVLELALRPDINKEATFASLASWRVT